MMPLSSITQNHELIKKKVFVKVPGIFTVEMHQNKNRRKHFLIEISCETNLINYPV